MNIREKIGERITQARKELGITIRELAARTKELSSARIGNWENGSRSPGPLEARLLADQLKVSAAYILCLTDNPMGDLIVDLRNGNHSRAIPLLDLHEVIHAKEIIATLAKSGLLDKNEKRITIDQFNKAGESSTVFAVLVDDASMSPDFNENELIVIEVERQIKPGDFVLAYLTNKNQVVLRQYCETDTFLYQLKANNALWANVNIKDQTEATIIGTVIEHRRYW